MKNILVVFTGGTIGSSVSAGTIDTSGSSAFMLLSLFQQSYANHQQVNFTTIQPLQILSENMAPPAWQMLIQAIEQANPLQYDGVIITHGTDTLAYTAAALSFYFNTIQIPMLLVSSDYPLTDPKANGLENFICAVEFISQQIAAGIFVPYRNPGQTMQIHKGSRLTCSLQLSGDFFSVQGKSYMQYSNGQFSALDSSPSKTPIASGRLSADFSKRILMIKPYPGLDYRHFDLNHTDAVLHDLYHSGTACATRQWGPSYALVEFIKQCQANTVQIYLAPAIKSANAYQSTQFLMAEGAEVIWNMSIEAAYVKLMLAYSNFTDNKQRMDFLNIDWAGELI
ncbi:MAG: asparaginase domain-containing protein [Methylococcales bacterium]